MPLLKVRGHTLIKAGPALFPDNSVEALNNVVFGAILAGYVHPAFDRDVGVCNRRRQELSKCTEKEGIPRHDPSPFLYSVLQLLEDGVLEDWVYHKDQRR